MKRFAGIAILLAALVVAAAGVDRWRMADQPDCPADAVALLLHATATPDTVRPRWSGCFDRSLTSTARPSFVTRAQVRGAVAAFELARFDRSDEPTQEVAVAHALAGESDRAIALLTAGAVDQPDVLSNMAGAYLLAAARSGSAWEVVLALNHASHALALAPSHRPALFNQALALTTFGFRAEAGSAWRHYLTHDDASEWAEAARAQLATLSEAPAPAATFEAGFSSMAWHTTTISLLCQASPQPCRERLEDSLLPEWARAVLDGDRPAAASLLDRATALAAALRTRGDTLDAETVDDLRRAFDRREPRLADAAAGLVAYGDARAAFEDDRESIPLFVEAQRRLAAAGSPMVGWARANRIYAEFNTYSGARFDAVSAELQAAAVAALSRGYRALAGRLFYLQSLTFANRANYVGAVPLFRDSLTELLPTRESSHLAATHVVIADAHMRVGEIADGWQALRDAVETIDDVSSARRRYAIQLNVGYWMTETGLPYAAVQILTSARDTAIATDQFLRVAESSLIRARAYSSVGNLVAARADLEIAKPDPARNARWGTGRRARHEYLAGVAEVEREANPPVAIAAATEALAFFGDLQYSDRVAPLYLQRGRAHAAAGDLESAERDVAAGIATYQRYRQTIPTARQRILSQDVVWDLYEEHLKLALRRSPDAAFAAAEAARGRSLLDSLPDAAAVTAPAELQRLLPADTRVLYYSLLPRALLIWTIGPDTVAFEHVAVDREVVERRVASLQESVQLDAAEGEWRGAAEDLFDLLVGRVQAALPPNVNITVVPDGALHRLPFAALRDRRAGGYLIESHAVTVVPSATLLARQLRHARPLRPPVTVFAVTDPVPTAGLPALPGSAREGQSIARLYAAAEVVSRERATKATFLLAAPKADVIHFAGHAVANPRYPLMAHLQFSAESGVSLAPTLDATEISGMRLERTMLVVLAACTTGGGQVRRGEGVLSLARPFLIAGAPAVVATLWDIDDAASAVFLSHFHEQFVHTRDAAVALREAQRRAAPLMRPSHWAAFIVVGQSSGGGSRRTSDDE